MKYKVWILAAGERTYATNAVEYDTQEAAENAARDLFNRWFSANEWAVLPAKHIGYLPQIEVDLYQVAGSTLNRR